MRVLSVHQAIKISMSYQAFILTEIVVLGLQNIIQSPAEKNRMMLSCRCYIVQAGIKTRAILSMLA